MRDEFLSVPSCCAYMVSLELGPYVHYYYIGFLLLFIWSLSGLAVCALSLLLYLP